MKLDEIKEKYRLSYHINYALTCQKIVGFKGKDVLEVGGCLPQELVLDHLECNSWTATESPDYDQELGNANQFNRYESPDKNSERYNFLLENIEVLPLSFHNHFDLIFSIAAFEHINKFPAALKAMYNALRGGGKLFTMFSPIWSAHDGHHLPSIKDKKDREFSFHYSPIPPWGHLLFNRSELYKHIINHTDKETAESIIYYVYNSPHINRFFCEDYINFVKESDFSIIRAELTFNVKVNPAVQKRLENLYPGRKYFSNNGLLLLLEKSLKK